MAEITIDARYIRSGGIGTYLQTLFSEIGEAAKGHRFTALIDPRDRFSWNAYPFVSTVAVQPRVYWPTEHWEIPRAVPHGSLLHVPHYNVPYFFRGALVATIHDLIPLHVPHLYRTPAALWYAKWMIRNALSGSHQIITGSNATKELIVRERVAEHRVYVIPYKVSRRLLEASPDSEQMERHGLRSGSYFLFVGRFQVHKNIDGLLDGFAEFCRRHPNFRLVTVVYKVDRRIRLRALLEQRSLSESVLCFNDVSFGFLKALYQGAIALVLPSLAEGFGLPVLEAMTLGTPVIGSNIPPIAEVSGSAALLVDPLKPVELADAMSALARDPHFRAE